MSHKKDARLKRVNSLCARWEIMCVFFCLLNLFEINISTFFEKKKSRIPEKCQKIGSRSLSKLFARLTTDYTDKQINNHIIEYDYLAVTVNVQSRLTVLIMCWVNYMRQGY